MSEKSLYTVSVINENDVDGVMDLLKRTFFIDEPLNEAVGLCTETGTCEELEEYCTESLLEGLSLKAVDNDGHIIAVAINGVCDISILFLPQNSNAKTLLSSGLKRKVAREITGTLEVCHLISGVIHHCLAQNCKNPKFQKILYILERREDGARLWEKFPQEKTLVEVKVVATDPKWRRKGIMNYLMQETENITKQRGIRILRLDTSSAYSAMSAESLGYTCVYKALYTDIKMNGEPLIVPKSPHIEDRVHIKSLF